MKKVITYGTFDLFHQGHFNIMKRAKDLGDYLIVGVTSESYDIERGKLNVQDSLVKRIENVRKTGLADEIIIEEYQGQKINDIIKYKVDLLVVGSDWIGKFDYLRNYCDVTYLERTKNISSTQIREEKANIHTIGVIADQADDRGLILETKYVSGLHVESVFSADRQVAEAFCSRYELDTFHTDLATFFAGVQIVYVNCNLKDRYVYAKKALEAKKHVICEAPASLSEEELKRLFAIAKENGVLLIENVVLAYLRAMNQLVWLLHGGLIGTILSVKCSIGIADFSSLDNAIALSTSPILVILKLLGVDTTTMHRNFIQDEQGNQNYHMINVNYQQAFSNVEIGCLGGIKNELVIIGSNGRVEVPDEWWNMGYFEASINNSPTIKRFSFNFEGNGLRYLLQEMLIMINDKRDECTRIFEFESIKMIEILNQLYT